MSDFDGATIPMKPVAAAKVATTLVPEPQKPASNSAIRISVFALLFVSLFGVGWGAWQFLHSTTTTDDEESIADLEGFETATESPKRKLDEETRPGRLSIPKPYLTSATTTGGVNTPELPPSLFHTRTPSTTESNTTADVWLTGTIEDVDTTARLELPQRISGGPNEASSVLR